MDDICEACKRDTLKKGGTQEDVSAIAVLFHMCIPFKSMFFCSLSVISQWFLIQCLHSTIAKEKHY